MEDSKKNAYSILELEPSPELDDAAIKKAYRRLAILKHPDKNRDNPKAAEEFAELEQAYRLLLDKGARGALDDLLRAQAQRAARESQVSDKRRKLREELERRERQSAGERSEEEMARQRLKMELERLRKKMEEEERRQRQQAAGLSAAMAVQRAAAAAADAAAAARNGGADASTSQGDAGAASAAVQEQLRRTLKVTWDPTSRQYSTEELRSIFGGFGAVQDVVLRAQKKKRKATALVVMGTEGAAATAAGSICGDPSDPLLVVPLVVQGAGAADGTGAGTEGETGDDPQTRPAGVQQAHARGGGGGADGSSMRAADGGGADGDDGLLPRDGTSTAGPGLGLGGGGFGPSLLQRPARLPEGPPGGRPLFPTAAATGAGGPGVSKPAFPISGGGLFPSAGAGSGMGGAANGGGKVPPAFPSAAAASGSRPAFPVGAAAGAFPSWRTSAATAGSGGGGIGGGGGGGSFEDEVLEKMRKAAAARQAAAAAAAAGKEASG